uniref:Uncharacterized protein n=1 Tax=Equus caballus TaxID=9796 RepID=A0A9L0SE75_HORSE
MPPALSFFLRIALAIRGLLLPHMNFRILCSISAKNVTGILIGIALNLYIALGSMDIVTMFILPIHVHGMSFHLFMASSISFTKVLQFSLYRSFTSLVKFTQRYFILFVAIVNGIVFLRSFSLSSLLEYRNATDLCMLMLYPATLLNKRNPNRQRRSKTLAVCRRHDLIYRKPQRIHRKTIRNNQQLQQ